MAYVQYSQINVQLTITQKNSWQKEVPFNFPNKLYYADDYDNKAHSQFSSVLRRTDDMV